MNITRDLLNEIQRALSVNLYYVALLTSLNIPDICGAMASTDGIANRSKYIDWFDKYVAPNYVGNLTGTDCWYFRCSAVHQGSSQNSRSTYSRVIFVEPSATTNIFHNNILNDALNLDVRVFCNDIISGALTWLQQNENTQTYIQNYSRFMRRYPNGLSPYIVGVSVKS